MTRIMRPLLSGVAVTIAFLNGTTARPLPSTLSALNDTSSLAANTGNAKLSPVAFNDSASGTSATAFGSDLHVYNSAGRLEARIPTNIPYVATNAEYTFWWKVRVLEQHGHDATVVQTAMAHDTQRNNPGMTMRAARDWVRSEILRLRPLFEGRPNRHQLERTNWALPVQPPGWVPPPPVPVEQDPFRHTVAGPAGPVHHEPAQVWPPPPGAIYYPPPPPQAAPPARRYLPNPATIQRIRDNFQFHLNCGLDRYEARWAVWDEEKGLLPYVSPADHEAAINEILEFRYRMLKSRAEREEDQPDHASPSDANSEALEYDPAPVTGSHKL
ncbi:hypothetical protein AC579_8589 [Pseudocercospora musae]|uniref:Uncharacterized protein n=1 Tax=Pseudocercospora musae TaxID=113226 RepID=A0A139IAZ0_9PEZI|nr:hypothetical protein AC579_8589 [Pseudocercospora musae]